MRNHASPHSGSKSLRLVVWFLFALFVVIGVSLGVKAVVMVRDSIFDGQHRFTVFFKGASSGAVIVSMEPQGRTVILNLLGNSSKKQAESSLLVPFDGSVLTKRDVKSLNSAAAILSAFLFSADVSYDTMTPYDLLRLYILSLQEAKDPVNETVTIAAGKAAVDPARRLFVDGGILSDNRTIAIVNSTGVSGLGQLLEQVLTTVGGSVVSVTTGRDLQEPTHIFYSGDKSYTVKRIERVFHQQAEEGNTQAADILIVVGKRSLPLGIFATLQE